MLSSNALYPLSKRQNFFTGSSIVGGVGSGSNTNSMPQSEQSSSSIDDIIKCYICFYKIKDATMCPYCQKLACQKCLLKWLRDKKNQCPYCRMTLKESQVIKISFMNDLASYIEKINLSKRTEKIEMCVKHNIQFLYFCSTCQVPLCSDCFMFENEHKTHLIKKMNEIYLHHLDNVNKEKTLLEHKCALLNKNLTDLNEKLNEIGTFRYKKCKALNETFKQMNEKLESRIEAITFKMTKFREEINEKLLYLETNTKKINKEINDSTQSELIHKSDDIIKQIKQLNVTSYNEEQLFKHVSLDLSNEITNDVIPKYASAKFEVDNYKTLLHNENSDIIFSPQMRINGLIWRVKLYPCGNHSAKGEFVSVFLELTDGLGVMDKNVYFYKIELINYEGKKNFIQEYSSEFANGESWGYSKFFRLDRLEKEGFIHKNGKIGINVYIRPQNYECLVRDLKSYIDVLERKVNGKEGDVKDDRKGNNKEEDEDGKMEGNWSYVKEVDVKEKMGWDNEEEDNMKVGRSYSWKCKKNCKEMLEGKVNEKVKENNQLQHHQQHNMNVINSNNNNDFRLLTQDNNNNKKVDNVFKPLMNKKIQKPKSNAFQIDLSLDDEFNLDIDDEVKQELRMNNNNNNNNSNSNNINNGFVIPPKPKNNDTFSDDSYGYIVDSLKYIDNQPKPKSKDKDNKADLNINNVNRYMNQFCPGNSTSSNRYKYMNSGGNPFLKSTNSKINDLKNSLFD